MSQSLTGTVAFSLAQSQMGANLSLSRTLNLSGNELVSANAVFVPPTGITINLSSSASAASVKVTGTELSGNIAKYTAVNTYAAGQNVTVTGCINNGLVGGL